MTDKLKVDKPYPELAIELVERFKGQGNEALWTRWVELERQKAGIEEVDVRIKRFLLNNAEGKWGRDMRNLQHEMREIGYREAKARNDS